MLRNILLGLCAALAIAVAALMFLLRAANHRAADCEVAARVQAAVMNQATADARRAIDEADALRRKQKATDAEIKLLHDQLEATAKQRPNFNARPRPTDADGHRSSILRAVRQ